MSATPSASVHDSNPPVSGDHQRDTPDTRVQTVVCSRCVMDDTEPGILFDEQGVCSLCKSFVARCERELYSGEEGRAKLAELADRIRQEGQGKEYDCVIGVSGGVDSTAVAYHVKRTLNLRPLAVHFDNGWNAELAVDNIGRALEALDIDLHTHVIDWDEFKDLQLSFIKASVRNIETPTDHGINALLYSMASKFGLRYIITGNNVRTEGLLPPSAGHDNIDLHHIKAIHRRFGKVRLRTMPLISIRKLAYLTAVRRIRQIGLLDYLDYDKPQALEMLSRELGFRPYGGKHYESIFTRFFQGYILPRKFSYDKRRAHLTCLVVGGQITREAALEELARDPYEGNDAEADREYVIKKFGLTDEEFEEIMNAPEISFREYPNSAWLLTGFPRSRRLFARFAKGKLRG